MPASGQGITVPLRERGARDGTSPSEIFETDGNAATRTFLVGWSDRWQVAQQALGYGYVQDGQIRRYLPVAHPEMPWLHCNKVARIVGVKWLSRTLDAFGQPVNQFKYAEMTLEYTHLPYNVKADEDINYEHERFVIEETRQSADYLSFPPGLLRWTEGPNFGALIPNNIGKIEVSTEIVLTWINIPDEALPWAAMELYVGCVNKTSFRDRGAGELLLLSANKRRRRMPHGGISWDVEYVMKHFSPGHNRLFNPNEGKPGSGYYQVAITNPPVYYPTGTAPDGVLVYDEAEFEDLFKPPPS